MKSTSEQMEDYYEQVGKDKPKQDDGNSNNAQVGQLKIFNINEVLAFLKGYTCICSFSQSSSCKQDVIQCSVSVLPLHGPKVGNSITYLSHGH